MTRKIRRSKENVLKHLKSFRLEPKFSIGVWYFYPNGGRFHEPYVEKGTIRYVLRKVAVTYDRGILDSTFGLEAHKRHLPQFQK
ncbi:hypothetical protein J7L29_00890 [Candidatus Bathyarchaeota archaeon]|nr:hypothetical protein [Candidatus Bathyarchaeota archaeon]